VLAYFEAFLKKLWIAVDLNAEVWYSYWIEDYMNALKSNDEALRTAACTYLTPIIIKINKPALAFIL
jgi:hypothetical protein